MTADWRLQQQLPISISLQQQQTLSTLIVSSFSNKKQTNKEDILAMYKGDWPQ